jgi:hypothetical protein
LPETRDDSDIAFIAAARSAVPWLLDLIDKLTEEELGEPADLPAEIADALIAAGTYGSWAETVISAMVEFVARDSTRLRALADGWAAAADRIDAANPRGYTDDSQNAYARRECAADLRAALGASSSVLVTPTEKDQR